MARFVNVRYTCAVDHWGFRREIYLRHPNTGANLVTGDNLEHYKSSLFQRFTQCFDIRERAYLRVR